jgi:hypothetical protein
MALTGYRTPYWRHNSFVKDIGRLMRGFRCRETDQLREYLLRMRATPGCNAFSKRSFLHREWSRGLIQSKYSSPCDQEWGDVFGRMRDSLVYWALASDGRHRCREQSECRQRFTTCSRDVKG